VAVLLRLSLLKGGGWNEQKESDLYFYPGKKIVRGSWEWVQEEECCVSPILF
jgi:hypothetical protein